MRLRAICDELRKVYWADQPCPQKAALTASSGSKTVSSLGDEFLTSKQLAAHGRKNVQCFEHLARTRLVSTLYSPIPGCAYVVEISLNLIQRTDLTPALEIGLALCHKVRE